MLSQRAAGRMKTTHRQTNPCAGWHHNTYSAENGMCWDIILLVFLQQSSSFRKPESRL